MVGEVATSYTLQTLEYEEPSAHYKYINDGRISIDVSQKLVEPLPRTKSVELIILNNLCNEKCLKSPEILTRWSPLDSQWEDIKLMGLKTVF